MTSAGRWEAGKAAYDAVAHDYAAAFRSTEPEQPIDLAMIDCWVADLRRHWRRPTVLDAGCGTGRMSRYLADQECQVTGIDVSNGMIEMARRDHPDIDTSVGSIADLPYGDATFEGAFYWYSVIHLPDEALPQVFTEAYRVIRPGGLALFSFQTGHGVRDVAQGYRRAGHPVTLLRYHRSVDQVSERLGAAGFVESMRLARAATDGEPDGQAVLMVGKPKRQDPGRES
ncbi:MAG: class I SAM-dependent methyltransferase [Ornithinimicrobium sp.]